MSGTIIFALAAPALLGAIGFGSVGPVAGSIAAGWQASIGSVTAGSLFAFLQSAAMGGPAMGVVAGIGGLGGGVMVAAGLAFSKGSVSGLMEKARGFFWKRKVD